jgi:nitrite reductase/ring-hydroxylating ferredoxin subunit/dissimilatory sulfite reductase (desulfoviridin) alpha/beta subunit
VGGKMGSGGFTIASPLDVFVEPREAAEVSAELIRIYRDHGPRDARAKCRLAFLIEEWGIARLRDELILRLNRDLEPAGMDMRRSSHTDHLGTQPQKQPGLMAVGLCVPTGRLDPAQMTELARLADVYGDCKIRLTTGQNAIIPNVPEQRVELLLKEPLLRQLSPAPSPFFRGLVACTGTDFCNLALIETKRQAVELSKSLEQRLGTKLDPLTIHWSGCPAGCGNHQAADIGLRGLRTNIGGQVVDAVAIYVGGRTGPDAVVGEQILETVPCDEALPDVVATVIKNLHLFKQVEVDPAAKERVLMVPAESTEDMIFAREELVSTRAAAASSGPNGHSGAAHATAVAVTEAPRVKACSLKELSAGTGRRITVQGKAVAVFALNGRTVAVSAECPHDGGPLDEGTIENGCIVCPWHRYGFDLASGRCDSDPSLSVKTYPTLVENAMVWVDLSE